MNTSYFKKTEKGRTYIFVPELNKWVYSNLASKELRKLGIDPQEWFDSTIMGFKDASFRPKCKHCGKELRWGGITIGYPIKFCSYSCSTSYRYDHPEEYENFINIQNEIYKNGSVGYMRSNPEKYKDSLESYENFNKNGGAAEVMRNRMNDEEKFIYECKLSKGTAYSKYSDVTEAFLYVQIFNDKIKVGTSKLLNAECRRLCSVKYNNDNIPPLEDYVFKGAVKDVVECEYLSKVKNFSNLYSIDSTEIFKLDARASIFNYINEFKLSKIDLTNQSELRY